jgi:hypothetical protein
LNPEEPRHVDKVFTSDDVVRKANDNGSTVRNLQTHTAVNAVMAITAKMMYLKDQIAA